MNAPNNDHIEDTRPTYICPITGLETFGTLAEESSQAPATEVEASEEDSEDGLPNEALDDPDRLARNYLLHGRYKGKQTEFSLNDQWRRWDREAGCYHTMSESQISGHVHISIKKDFDLANLAAIAKAKEAAEKAGKKLEKSDLPQVFKVTGSLKKNVLGAMSATASLPPETQAPCWLEDGKPPRPARDIVATSAGVVDLWKFSNGDLDAVKPKTAALLNSWSIQGEIRIKPKRPKRWLKFLEEVWGEDAESIDCLQDWFGYALDAHNDIHKIALLYGRRRSGKSTVLKVMEKLLGEGNVANPSFTDLSSHFGLSNLVGKSAIQVTDARTSTRTDTKVALENLLRISGQDKLDINRKHLPTISLRLNAKITIASNALPSFLDSSSAFVGRLVALEMPVSFEGSEDRNLINTLTEELPGIFTWAVIGWRRIKERGHFIQPESSKSLLSLMCKANSPVSTFVEERCEVREGSYVFCDDLFREWASWCEINGYKSGDSAKFGRELSEAFAPRVTHKLRRDGAARRYAYFGIQLDSSRLLIGASGCADFSP